MDMHTAECNEVIRRKLISIVGTLALSLGLYAATTGTASAVTYFPLTDQAYVIQGNGNNLSWLSTVDQTVDPWTLTQIPNPPGTQTYPVRINNLGFRVENPTGGLLYATEWTTSVAASLITIDAAGVKTLVGTTGAALPKNLNAGDVSIDGSYMYLTISGGGGTNTNLYTINLSSLNVTSSAMSFGASGGATAGGRVNDFAYYNGLLYGGDQRDGDLAILDPSTGARTDVPLGLPTGTAFGGAYFDSAGTLWLYENSTGKLYPVTDLAGTPSLGSPLVNAANITVDIDAAAYAGVVPVPAAVWLFGSGLLGLVGVARRKKA